MLFTRNKTRWRDLLMLEDSQLDPIQPGRQWHDPVTGSQLAPFKHRQKFSQPAPYRPTLQSEMKSIQSTPGSNQWEMDSYMPEASLCDFILLRAPESVLKLWAIVCYSNYSFVCSKLNTRHTLIINNINNKKRTRTNKRYVLDKHPGPSFPGGQMHAPSEALQTEQLHFRKHSGPNIPTGQTSI